MYFWEDFGWIVVAIVVAVLVLGGAIGGSLALSRATCDKISEVNSHLEFKWAWQTGCMVQMPDGIWYSIDSVKYVGLNEGG